MVSREDPERLSWYKYFIEPEANYLQTGILQTKSGYKLAPSSYSSIYRAQGNTFVFYCDWLLETDILLRVEAQYKNTQV